MKKIFTLITICLSIVSLNSQNSFGPKTEKLLKNPDFSYKNYKINHSKKTLNVRSDVSTDTAFVSYANFANSYSQLRPELNYVSLFQSGGNNFPYSTGITNYIDTASSGRSVHIDVIYNQYAYAVVSNGTYFYKYYVADSIQSVDLDSFFFFNTAFFCDTNSLDGDSLVFSFHKLLNDTIDPNNEIKRLSFKDKSGLLPFYNNGRYYSVALAPGITLNDGEGFGVRIKYYTQPAKKDTNVFAVSYGYLDSCGQIEFNGQTLRSPAHRPIFPQSRRSIDISTSQDGNTATTRQTSNIFAFNINGIPANCRYVYVQDIQGGAYVRIHSKLSGVLSWSDFNKTSFCPNDEVIIQPNVSGGKTPYTYKWATSSGTIDNDTDPVIRLTLGGSSATVSLTVTDANLDQIILNRSVNVSTASVNISSSKTVLDKCIDEVELTANATPSNGITYMWSNGESTDKVTVNKAGKYTVTITNSSQCSAVDDIEITTTYQTPNFNFVLEKTTICPGDNVKATIDESTTVNGWTYKWYDASTFKDSGTFYTFSWATPGRKTITMKANEGDCEATPVVKNVEVLSTTHEDCGGSGGPVTSITQSDNISNINIYPNPVNNGIVNIDNKSNEKIEIRIVDILGEELYRKAISNNKLEQIKVGNYSNGVYFIEVYNENNRFTNKIMIDNK